MTKRSEIDDNVRSLLTGSPEGDELTPGQAILINLALHVSATASDEAGSRMWIATAVDAGISREQIQEIITLVSGIGTHAFFHGSRALSDLSAPEGGYGPLDEHRQQLWDRHIGSTKYWTIVEEEVPGFLEALLRMSPQAFEAFIQFAGLPFRSTAVDLLTKELISLAVDISPSHVYLPGMRIHLRNALRLGAGRVAIEQTASLAAKGPPMIGIL